MVIRRQPKSQGVAPWLFVIQDTANVNLSVVAL